MKYLFLASILSVGISAWSQVPEETFKVKKRPEAELTERQLLFNLNLSPGVNTICRGLWVDLRPLKPHYDSLAIVNLKLKFTGTKVSFFETTTIGEGGHAIMRFLKKQKDGSYKLIYIRNWQIDCHGLKKE